MLMARSTVDATGSTVGRYLCGVCGIADGEGAEDGAQVEHVVANVLAQQLGHDQVEERADEDDQRELQLQAGGEERLHG